MLCQHHSQRITHLGYLEHGLVHAVIPHFGIPHGQDDLGIGVLLDEVLREQSRRYILCRCVFFKDLVPVGLACATSQ
jgi:hypothetical protein